GLAPGLFDVDATRSAGVRPLMPRAARAAQHVEVQHADARLAADGMAQRADQQCGASVSVGIGSAADVPPEPPVRLVAKQLTQDRTGLSREELDTANPVAGVTTIRGRADGDVLDTVAIEIAGRNHHASEQLARLAPRPAAELLPGAAGIDVNLSRKE